MPAMLEGLLVDMYHPPFSPASSASPSHGQSSSLREVAQGRPFTGTGPLPVSSCCLNCHGCAVKHLAIASAAKHKLLVKPRNQRSSKMRRLSSVTGQGQGGWAWSPICPQYRLPALKDPCPLRNPHRLWDHDHASGSGVGQGFNIN